MPNLADDVNWGGPVVSEDCTPTLIRVSNLIKVDFLGFTGPLVAQCAEQIQNLYKTFLTVDCLQLEVNPLAETPQGQVRYYQKLMKEAPFKMRYKH